MLTVEQWNAQHPIGTLVLAWPGTRDAEPLVTMTRSAAWPLGHGEPVVAVEGKAGGIALTHVEPRGPRRLQRRRVAGWTNLTGATYVGRPTMFGNPFAYRTRSGLARVPAVDGSAWEWENRISGPGIRHDVHHPDGHVTEHTVRYMTRAETVETFRRALTDPQPSLRLYHRRHGDVTAADVRRELAGRDLLCWCPLVNDEGQPVPCHADVLLEVANLPDTAPEPSS